MIDFEWPPPPRLLPVENRAPGSTTDGPVLNAGLPMNVPACASCVAIGVAVSVNVIKAIDMDLSDMLIPPDCVSQERGSISAVLAVTIFTGRSNIATD